MSDPSIQCSVILLLVKQPDIYDGYDGLVGLDVLKRVNAKIDITKNIIEHDHGTEQIFYSKCRNVNIINIDDVDIPKAVTENFKKMIKNRLKAFADPNKSFTFNINTVATIRTDGEPVYSKLYPYPMGVAVSSIQRLNIF